MKPICLVLIAVGLLTSCRRNEIADAGHPPAVVGHWVTATEYENAYFNLRVTLPAGWEVKKGSSSEINQQAVEFLAGEDKNLRSMMEAAVNKTLTIFWAYRYPVGTPGKSNPNVSMLIEDVSRLPGVASADDYLAAIKQTIAMSGKEFHFAPEMEAADFGGVSFRLLRAELPMGVMRIRQSYYATMEGRHVLLMGVTTLEEADEAEVAKVTSTIKPVSTEDG